MEELRELVRGLRDGKIMIVDSEEEEEEKDVLGKVGDGDHGKSKAEREICIYGDAIASLAEAECSLARQRGSGAAEGGGGGGGRTNGDEEDTACTDQEDSLSMLAELRLELGAHDFARGRIHKSIDHFEQARTLAARAKADALSTRAEYFLAQSYQREGDAARAARSCAGTLKAQLRARTDESTASSFDVYSWVNNCLQLAGYFLNDEDDFRTAKHCTRVADAVCAAHVGDNDTDDARAARANVKLAWAKLCLNALRRRPVVAAGEGGNAAAGEEGALTSDDDGDGDDEGDELAVTFHDEMPSLVRDPAAANGDGAVPLHIAVDDVHLARRAFNTGMTCFNAALEYYTLDSWASECCEMVIDRNGLYIGLSRFEPDARRRRALHKARANLVLPLLREMNAEKFSNLFRSLHFDAAEALVAVMDTYEHDDDDTDATENHDDEMTSSNRSSSVSSPLDATGDGGYGSEAHVSATKKTKKDMTPKLRRKIINVGRSAAAHYEAILAASTLPPSSLPSSASSAGASSTEASTHMDASDVDFLRKVHFSSARVYTKLSSLIAAESGTRDSSARSDAARAVSAFDTYVTLSHDAVQCADEVDVATQLAGLIRAKFKL